MVVRRLAGQREYCTTVPVLYRTVQRKEGRKEGRKGEAAAKYRRPCTHGCCHTIGLAYGPRVPYHTANLD